MVYSAKLSNYSYWKAARRLGVADFAGEVSQGIIEYIRKNPSADCYALIEAVNSPVPGTTKESRPWYQFNLRTLTRR